ncbi:hypothetical protein TSUD_16110 [Trifolium subterraneum]|uniref:Cytochrome b6-f complex subunit 7 n=1 Tax=Trifolium subterraneum TaxID=3900 RepID=A0A2Z6NYZ8_TRISU|nr:hypothetical protein TSUD_16110 [Trifolium subterraneum]
MATASAATASTITVVGSSIIGSKSRSTKNVNNVKLFKGFNTFNGLKAQNNPVSSLGVSISSDQAFVQVMCSLKYPSMVGRSRRGGAAATTCNAAGEIFQIAAVINGLTLVGVAVGFVLLRIEAAVEEAE